MKIYDFYVQLIHNPFAPKQYRELAKAYETLGKKEESDVFLHALNVKFDNAHIDEEQ